MQGPRHMRKVALTALLAAQAAGARAEGEARLPDLHELEVKVWTADEHDLVNVEKELVRSIQLEPDSAMAHHLLSRAMIRMFARDPGELYSLKQASDLAQQAIDLDPRSDVGYVALADILDLMGNADRGLQLLNEALATGLKATWRVHFTKARLMSDAAKPQAVLKTLEDALSAPGCETRVVVPYVVALLQSEASGEALITELASWNRRFPAPLFELTAAITHAELGQHKKAHELYQAIVKANPKNKEAKVNDGILLYRDLKEPAKAVKVLEDALAVHDHDLSKTSKAMITAHLGAALLSQKEPVKAEAQFVRALELDHGSVGLIDFVTRVHRDQKAHKELVGLIRKLNDRIPGTSVLHALLGETLSEKLSDHDGAVKAFADAIILEPARADYYNGMGLAFYRKKSYPEALKLFVAATEVDPNDATARYNEACVLSLMGRGEEAVNTLAEAVSLDPRLLQNARSDTDFENIKGNLKYRELVQQAPTLPGDPLLPSH